MAKAMSPIRRATNASAATPDIDTADDRIYKPSQYTPPIQVRHAVPGNMRN
jgi:hypothetical protein